MFDGKRLAVQFERQQSFLGVGQSQREAKVLERRLHPTRIGLYAHALQQRCKPHATPAQFWNHPALKADEVVVDAGLGHREQLKKAEIRRTVHETIDTERIAPDIDIGMWVDWKRTQLTQSASQRASPSATIFWTGYSWRQWCFGFSVYTDAARYNSGGEYRQN
jgi:hypothetical protein